ncbi:hypothetical protein TCAL_14385 [Tigriopus californicus]|uniref:Uncharacterized protein n=1 Tax=Tigriopus californicus TaxID=6832 RepID=A0A553PJE8_TIGCA|nr:uncharacterized protein LOC131890203 [Tigriopus californicus]XP_059095492.1 uncharacterized protein LOC131890203 [Tigriopus californicus]TRY77811.1 hypothetical protein TCAL_14385 [Tigriopus californicus]
MPTTGTTTKINSLSQDHPATILNVLSSSQGFKVNTILSQSQQLALLIMKVVGVVLVILAQVVYLCHSMAWQPHQHPLLSHIQPIKLQKDRTEELRRDKSLRFVDWFEASGPDASCEIPAGVLDSSILQDGDEKDLPDINEGGVQSKMSRIDVCRKASPGDEKCICARKPFSRKEYKLECGVCSDPCALEFIPRDETKRSSMKQMMTEDLKQLLMESFFQEVLNTRRKK